MKKQATPTPKLWLYQGDGNKWYGHIDWKDGSRIKREGPFDSEAQAGVVLSRMNGMTPPDDLLREWNRDTGRKDKS